MGGDIYFWPYFTDGAFFGLIAGALLVFLSRRTHAAVRVALFVGVSAAFGWGYRMFLVALIGV